MDELTTVRLRKSTVVLLKAIATNRGRRESMEQVILELVAKYAREATHG